MDVTTAILFTVTCDKSMSVGTLTTHWQVCYWNAYENQRAPKMHSVCVSRWHGEDWEQFSWSHPALPNSELALLRPQDKNYWLNFFFYLLHVLSNSAGTKPCLNCHSRQVLFFPLGLRLTGRKKEENNGWNNKNKIFIKCEHLLYILGVLYRIQI